MDYLSIILEATQFIHRNYDENILVADISEYVYLSPSYFSKVFSILTGYTGARSWLPVNSYGVWTVA